MMPEAERESFDEQDWFPWDLDNNTAGESETADLLDDGDE